MSSYNAPRLCAKEAPTTVKQIQFVKPVETAPAYHLGAIGGICEEVRTPAASNRDASRSSVFSARLVTGVLLVLVSMGPQGCYETRTARERAIAHGKMLFELHCCGCHSGRRLDLAKNPPNLAGIFLRPSLPSGRPATDAMVRSTILVGRSGIMPSFQSSLSDKEIEDIIRYLHSVGGETRLCAIN
jgi:mono/diheme cytochrome c family protein